MFCCLHLKWCVSQYNNNNNKVESLTNESLTSESLRLNRLPTNRLRLNRLQWHELRSNHLRSNHSACVSLSATVHIRCRCEQPVDDLYLHMVPGCAHEQIAHSGHCP